MVGMAAGGGYIMTKPILVVDDSATIRMGLEELIRRIGHDVRTAGSAEEALSLVDGGLSAKLVLTDYNMPGANGVEFIKQLRTRAAYRFTPIIVVTTESQADLRGNAKSAGATGWLVKPVKPAQLTDVIQKVLPNG